MLTAATLAKIDAIVSRDKGVLKSIDKYRCALNIGELLWGNRSTHAFTCAAFPRCAWQRFLPAMKAEGSGRTEGALAPSTPKGGSWQKPGSLQWAPLLVCAQG